MNLSMKSITNKPVLLAVIALFLSACHSPQESASSHLAKGKKLFEQGDYDKAFLELKLSNQNNQQAEAYYYMALMDEKRNSLTAMRQNLRRALEIDSGLIPARSKLGVVEILSGEYDKALEQAEAILVLHPNNIDAQILKATVYFQQGKYDQSLKALEAVDAVDPDNMDVLSLKTMIFVKRGEINQALALIDRGLKKSETNIPLRFSRIKINADRNNSSAMIDDYRELIKFYPDTEDYKLKLAAVYAMVDRLKEAEEVLQGMIVKSPSKLDPKMVLLEFLNAKLRGRVPAEYEKWLNSNQLTSKDQLALSKWLLANNYQDIAVRGLQKIVADEQDKPDGLIAQTVLGEVALSKKEYKEVDEIVGRVLKANSDLVEASLLKARLLITENKLDEAINLLNKTSWSGSNSGDAFFLLGQAYQAKNDIKQAQKSYKDALDVNPGNLGAFFPVYDAYLQANQKELARMILEKALRLKPNQETLLGVKVAQDIEEKQWDDADNDVQRFLMFSKNKFMPIYFKANILQGRGQYAKAIAVYEELLKDRPDDFKSMVNLARSYEGMKARDQAINFLQKHHNKYPDNLTVVGVLDELYFANHDLAKAKQLVTDQLARSPNAVSLYLELARIEAVLRKTPDAAKEIYLKGLQANPDDLRLQLALAGWYQQTGDATQAIKTYGQLLEKHPESEMAINNMAELLLDSDNQEDIKKGFAFAEKFKDSDRPVFQDTYAWGLIKTGHPDLGLKLLDTLVVKEPKLAELRYHSAIAHYNNGNLATALTELKQAINLSEKQKLNFSGKDDARKLLKELESNGKE